MQHTGIDSTDGSLAALATNMRMSGHEIVRLSLLMKALPVSLLVLDVKFCSRPHTPA